MSAVATTLGPACWAVSGGKPKSPAAVSQLQIQNPKPKSLSLPLSANCSCNLNFSSFNNHKPTAKPSSSVRTSVAAVDSDQISSSTSAGKSKYYFVVANAKFMLDEEEHFQEQLLERFRYYGEKGREQDFWLVIEPKFLEKFPSITKRLGRPAVALVSTNGPWITFMKLRLDRVLAESFEAESLEDALASNPTNIKFEKPSKWVAPYPKYESEWWGPFLPPGSKEEAKV